MSQRVPFQVFGFFFATRPNHLQKITFFGPFSYISKPFARMMAASLHCYGENEKHILLNTLFLIDQANPDTSFSLFLLPVLSA